MRALGQMLESTPKNGITLIDGGTGSELRRRGFPASKASWTATASLTHTALLTQIHRDFVLAGADVITANTFAASRFVLAAEGRAHQFEAIVDAAIKAAREASEPQTSQACPPRVAASLSCYPATTGGGYPPMPSELSAYRRLVEKFAHADIDLILVEMMQDPEHGARACQAASESGIPFWLGLSCRRSEEANLVGFDRQTVPLSETMDRLLEFEPDAVAIMHSPIDTIDEALDLLRSKWRGPIGVYPEVPYETASPPNDSSAESRLAEQTPPETLCRHFERWLSAGVTIVGGCCGTTPTHIAELRALIERSGT